MPDDADWAAEMEERERAARLARHRRREPPPQPARAPARLDQVMDEREGAR